MTNQRPPIPKFNEGFLTNKVEMPLIEEAQHLTSDIQVEFGF